MATRAACLLAVLACALTPLSPRAGELHANVIDSEGKPLPDAVVVAFPVENGVVSDADDHIEIPRRAAAQSGISGQNAATVPEPPASEQTAAEGSGEGRFPQLMTRPGENPGFRTAFRVKYVAQDAAYIITHKDVWRSVEKRTNAIKAACDYRLEN